MRILTLVTQVVLIVSAVNAVATAAENHTFRAGAATSDITPKLGLPIVGNWNSPPATAIHDKLHVRCLVLDDGETKLAFAICDSVGILSNGTSGDVNNIRFTEPGSRREPYEKINQVAELIASRVAEAHQSLEFHDTEQSSRTLRMTCFSLT